MKENTPEQKQHELDGCVCLFARNAPTLFKRANFRWFFRRQMSLLRRHFRRAQLVSASSFVNRKALN